MLGLVKSLIPSPARQQLSHWAEIMLVEYNFRFRRQEILKHLENLRHLPCELHIEGTNICNAKCTFCAYRKMERPKETMSMELFQRVIDEYVAMGGKNVYLTPIVGEPLVDSSIFERLDYLWQFPQIEAVNFNTNAILLSPKVSERLLAYGDKLRIFVSFGGFDRETYKSTMGVDYFNRVWRNIEAFIEAKQRTNSSMNFTIGIRCPSSKCTGEIWEKVCAYEKEGLINMLGLGLKYDSWAGKVKPEELRNIGLPPVVSPHKRGACEMLYAKPVILANGKVNACACRDVEAELIIGDINESPLKELWESPAIEELIDRHEKGDFPDVCQRCTHYVSVYNQRKSIVFTEQINWK